jgi:glutamine synthetase
MAGGSGPYGLTEEAEAFMAGILDGLPALLAIGAPSVASYLRLIPERWSAPWRCWGRENREAGVRLAACGTHANVEVKCIDAAANPYLLVGAVMALGLDGIERALRLPPEVTVDPASLGEGEVERLPRSLEEALREFRGHEVLTEALGPELHGTIVAVREAELARFAGVPEEDVVAETRRRY